MSPVYSFVYINEIKFKGDEFVEIYSNETLNLTEMKVYDKDLNTNTLSLLKNFSSNYTLIIGKNFKSNELNNISSLNCTIYVTSGAQVLHGGAPNSGENLIIQINNETNISWIKNKNFSFKDEETLNFNYENKNYYVSNSTPCLPNLELEQMQNHSNNSLNKTEQLSQIPQNDSNTPQNQSEDLTSCQDYTFEIIPVPEGEIFDSKIQYKFETNAEENYSISYWIESYRGDIVRSKRETTNTNTKSYTPRDFTQIYRIKAYLEYRGCKIEDERVVSFYSDNEEDIEEEDDTSDTYTDDESYIKIPNENDILNHRTNELVYEIYRGDTSKENSLFLFKL